MRIGIVNDLGLAREALRRVVASEPGLAVAWTASDGREAVERARQDRPDLILMDLIMPEVDGVEATRRIMADHPCAILVVTSTVSGHMGRVYEAMGLGALDAIDTPELGPGGELRGAGPLLQKIATIGNLIGKPLAKAPGVAARPADVGPLVLLGASTGGPNALAEILSALPHDGGAGVVIVQHVDAAFAPGLASWLAGHTGLRVEPIARGQRPAPGRVLLAATNDHLVLTADRRLDYVAEPVDACYRPSVDVFFASVADHWPVPGVAAVLTGMGRDGAEGLLRLRRHGWHTIAQDPPTCVVAGMPRAAAELGAAAQVLPLPEIAGAIVEHLRGAARPG